MENSSTMRAWIFRALVCGIISVILCGVVWARRQNLQVTELRNELSALQRSQRQPPEVVRELRTIVQQTQTAALAVPAAASSDAGQRKAATTPLTPEEAQYRAERLADAQERLLADSYARESADPQWSAAAEIQLRTAFSDPSFGALSMQSECRTTCCRVSFRYSDPAGAEQWRGFNLRAPWGGATAASVNNETRTGVFYLARDGYDLPSVDPATLQL